MMSETDKLCNEARFADGMVDQALKQQADIDRLKGELEEANSWSLKAVEQFNRAEDLERQIAEARAEIDKLRKICDPETEIEACEMIESVKQEARQEAARKILADLQKCLFAVDFEVVRDNIKYKFKLEE